jgi:replication fork protection complex subunit Csm3/Swi3
MMRKSWIDEEKPKRTQEYDDDFVDVDQVMQQGEDGAMDVERDGNSEGARQVDGTEGDLGMSNAANTGRTGQVSSPPLEDDEGLYDESGPPIVQANKEAEDQEPDEDELDALMAEDAANANTPTTQTAKHVPPQAPPGEADFADDEEAMAEMDMW